ncbi:hypothetical protein EYF80_003619 [Liparis tanakae]|uniref:Uncharacterized protein n=1 Tax=Liparis tanakae TaxID=230148 RepID=A0A4Z2J9W3_9TELE|nr:hypothetical protein EYF80_003619 [Liparis tanakae]
MATHYLTHLYTSAPSQRQMASQSDRLVPCHAPPPTPPCPPPPMTAAAELQLADISRTSSLGHSGRTGLQSDCSFGK